MGSKNESASPGSGPDRARVGHPSGLPPALLSAPPWILGHRGAPLDAPENTLSSLERALGFGLDGVEYDLQGSREGEPVLLHDDTLERTAQDPRAAHEVTLAEMAHLEVGGWFQKRFAGEALPLFADALQHALTALGQPALHMIELKRADLVERVVEILREDAPALPVRIASFHREVCLAARDAGLPSMLLAVRWHPDDHAWLRRERIEALGLGPGGWRDVPRDAATRALAYERWGWGLDDPDHLLEACRVPFFGFNTNEPRRALGARALVRLAPHDTGRWPLEVPVLEVGPDPSGDQSGAFAGRWTVRAAVRNPFEHPIAVELEVEVRRGAFEVSGIPAPFELGPGARREVEFQLAGGSFSPGLDPLLVGHFELPPGPGREPARLRLDAPLERVRRALLRSTTTRLLCLPEVPGGEPVALNLRRRGAELVLDLEHAPGLVDPRVAVLLDGELRYGLKGLRMTLPEDFDNREGGTTFSAGVVGTDPATGRPTWRRWAGGLPSDLLSGVPGRLVAGARA